MAKQYHIPRTINKIEVKVGQVSETEALKINIFTYIRKKINSFKRVCVINLLSVSKIPNILPPWHFIHARHVVNITLLSFFIDGKKIYLVSLQKRQWKSKLWGALIGLGNTDDEDKEGMAQLRYPFARAISDEYSDRGAVFAGFFYFLVKNNFALHEPPS